MAVDRVEKRLKKVTAALDAAGIKYAVIGDNAVAAWVARVDPAATRSTKYVDLLVPRTEAARLSRAMRALGFLEDDIVGVRVFIDPDEPSVRSAVHIVWANELVRPQQLQPAPSIDESELDPQGFRVVNLAALVRMKLTAFRLIDKVHIQDLMKMKLIDSAVRLQLPEALHKRLLEVESTFEDDLQDE